MIHILKCLYEPLIKRYEQLNFSQKSEIRKFKSGIPFEKWLRKFITGKGFSAPQKHKDFKKKI